MVVIVVVVVLVRVCSFVLLALVLVVVFILGVGILAGDGRDSGEERAVDLMDGSLNEVRIRSRVVRF